MRRAIGALVLTLLAVVVAALLAPPRTGDASYPVTADQLRRARADLDAVAALPRTAPTDVPDYDRDAFGARWADVDHNGCDTRNDILARDLTGAVTDPGTRGCVVLAGTLADRYTGRTIEFRRGQDTSALVQIDHVVALADAWRSGAHAWDADRRRELANDPANLLAVDGDANQTKSASAADAWLPDERGFRCQYAVLQLAVKARWALSVTDAEHRALERTLDGCDVVG